MNPFVVLILTILDIYWWVVIAMVIMSWLVAFNVVNIHNHVRAPINFALHRLTEPLLRPIRQFMPDLGGLDLSPVVLFIGIIFVRYLIVYYLGGVRV